MLGTLVISILILLALVIGWHLLFPLMGGVIAITATVWFVIVGSIVAFCIGILLLFVFTGVGIFLLGLLALIGTIAAIVLFPILFPILLPLFVVFLFVSYVRRRHQDRITNKKE
jgi:hypothetical protein